MENRFLSFAPVDLRRKPEPVPLTQVLSYSPDELGVAGDARRLLPSRVGRIVLARARPPRVGDAARHRAVVLWVALLV